MNAVIYARFSSHAQNEQSIEGQLRTCYEYAEKHGIKVVGEYIDRAMSARTDDRPEFLRMVSDAKKEQFRFVLVYRLDRFSRNRYDSAIYKHKLKQSGVKVLSAMENIGDNPESIILEAILEASAEYYSVELAQKTIRGMKLNAEKGGFNGGSPGYGYKSVDGQLEIDEKMAPAIKYVLESYADGMSLTKAIKMINSQGYRTLRGKKFTASPFYHILRSPKYYGIIMWDGEESGTCPPLISKETFDKNQVRLAQNKRTGGKAKAKIPYHLTGKLFCGPCGEPMHGVSGTGRNGAVHTYYSCNGRRLKKTNCTKEHEKKDYIEWYIVEQTVEYVLDPIRIPIIAKAVVEQYEKDFDNTKIIELERQIAILERDIESCIDMLLEAPESARPRLYDRIENYTAQKEDAEINLRKLRIANGIKITEEEIITWLKSFCTGDLFDDAFRERIIDVFIHSIYLYDETVVIFYNVKGGKQTSYIGPKNKNEPDEDPVRVLSKMAPRHIENTNQAGPKFVFVNGFFGVIFNREEQ